LSGFGGHFGGKSENLSKSYFPDFQINSVFPLEKPCYAACDLFFLFPKEIELAENKAIDQEEYLIERQDQKKIEERIDKAPFLHSKKIQDGIFDKQDREPRASKDHQNHDYLKETFQFPLGLKSP
jgi:hypothetical protein